MQVFSMDLTVTRLTECLNREALEAVVGLRATPEEQERMDWLSEQANEGLLTPQDRREYEQKIMFGSFLGILQARAKKKLRPQSA
jgi:uncharacterized NAD(P)/FAD-binding protein YdhS